MKNRVPKHLLLLAFVLASAASAADSADEVKQAETNWAAAVKAGDTVKVEGMLADGLIYTHSNALVETKAEYMNNLKSGHQKYTNIEHVELTAKRYGNTGIAASKVRMQGTTKGVPFDNQLRMTHVWVKQGNKWLLVAHQTTRVP